ncbi:hypothetical protein BJ322DRAFT_1112234 [Thelephora terrestris]|uniref:F-box domain-containing protein n=1 Tax=Thelephora terrestris TaxID=56493 RepID=A0A9P6H7K8_9AGAM|nr:hypothetical protein BJ322DRAFT_1112234 [Thelephora terrestris]
MSLLLPQEIIDLIIDHLHDEPATLNACCGVSKSWLQRARKHLFVRIKFSPLGRHVKQWKETFPDPTNSPAHETRTLSISHPMLITAAYVDTLLTFGCVVNLDVNTDFLNGQSASLVPLLGFSPAIRSLRLTFVSLPNSEIFNLACSFPLLDDLALICRAHRHRHVAWKGPSTSPRFTGSLELCLMEGIYPTSLLLLDLPNGLHFTTISVLWLSDHDIGSTMNLVSRCSDTLESLEITNHLSGVLLSMLVLDEL